MIVSGIHPNIGFEATNQTKIGRLLKGACFCYSIFVGEIWTVTEQLQPLGLMQPIDI